MNITEFITGSFHLNVNVFLQHIDGIDSDAVRVFVLGNEA